MYEQALFIAREIRDHNREARLLREIGVLCLEQGNNDQAMEYLEQCLDICENIDCKEAGALALENIASIYNTKKSMQRPWSIWNKALAYYGRWVKRKAKAKC